jgi:hypothetical protein
MVIVLLLDFQPALAAFQARTLNAAFRNLFHIGADLSWVLRSYAKKKGLFGKNSEIRKGENRSGGRWKVLSLMAPSRGEKGRMRRRKSKTDEGNLALASMKCANLHKVPKYSGEIQSFYREP